MAELSYLSEWLTQQLNHSNFSLQSLAGGAGLRQYYRVLSSAGNKLMMYVPPDAEVSLLDFINTDKALAELGVRVPALYQTDLANGLLLLEDFGDGVYDQVLNHTNADTLYQQALDQLIIMQRCDSIANITWQNFAQDFFDLDLTLWREWCVQQYWHTIIPDELFNQLRQVLWHAITEQPTVCMHRDYHSRNLIYLVDTTTGVLDFQSAMRGPLLYDVASLLRDCYVDWPAAKVHQWLDYFFQQSPVAVNYTSEQLWRWFDLRGLQRHLKALGTFTRKIVRDKDQQYVTAIERTLNYILATTAHYPELGELHQWLRISIGTFLS